MRRSSVRVLTLCAPHATRAAAFVLATVLASGLATVLASGVAAQAATYDVGPGFPRTTIGAIPWATLQPGDVVRIHWQAAPYREKWVIGRSGTAGAPIVVTGVRGPGGERPVIDGSGAVTAPGLNFWSEGRGVIKVGGSNVPASTYADHVVIEGLEIRNARPPATFTGDDGTVQGYPNNGAAIFVEKGRHVTIRDCVLRDSGNGLFVASSDTEPSRDILVEGNDLVGNGNAGSIYEHNSYTAAIGITFQYNRYGPLCTDCGGNNLKDRSAGTVVRYNFIEGGNRQLDLVDAEDSSLIRADASYGTTHVYGNVLVEPAGAGNRQIAHYGGDSGATAQYRKGTLHFYANTVVSYRTDRTTLLRLSTNDEHADARDNIVYTAAAAGNTLSLLDTAGTLDWTHNGAKPGWVVSFGSFGGTFHDAGTTVTFASPGFVDEAGGDFHLAATSACRDAGTTLLPAVLPAHDVTREYRRHQASDPRPKDATYDIGAYEYAACVPGSPPGAVSGLVFAAPGKSTLTWSGAPRASVYDVVRGDLGTLRATDGNFTAATNRCVENDGADTTATDAPSPAPGAGFWFLVRAVDCVGAAGTYDDPGGGAGQAAPRDAAIDAAGSGCP